MTVTRQESPPTPPGVAATFDIAVTNHNNAACATITFQLEPVTSVDGVTTDLPFLGTALTNPVAGGQTAHLTLSATADDSVDPQQVALTFFLSATDFATNLCRASS